MTEKIPLDLTSGGRVVILIIERALRQAVSPVQEIRFSMKTVTLPGGGFFSSVGLNLSVIACAMPPPLSRGGLGIPQSFTSSPEAPLQGELSPKVTERLYEGQPAREPQPCRKGTALFNFPMSLPRIQAETVKTQKNRFPSCQTGQNALFYSHSLTV